MLKLQNIDTIKDFVDEVGLFENKKIYFVKNCKGIDEKNLNNIKKSQMVFLFLFKKIHKK